MNFRETHAQKKIAQLHDLLQGLDNARSLIYNETSRKELSEEDIQEVMELAIKRVKRGLEPLQEFLRQQDSASLNQPV